MGKLVKLNITPQWIKKGQNVLAQLSDEEAEAVIGCVMNIVLADIKMGLAGTESGPVFESVNELYQEHVGQCYFCNQGIDANAVEFNLDRHLCLFCMLKVANLLTAFDLPGHEFFPGMGARTDQS